MYGGGGRKEVKSQPIGDGVRTLLILGVNHYMAAWNFRDRKKQKTSVSFHQMILMSTVTWITGKEIEREIYNNRDQFHWKKNEKIIQQQ